MVYYRDMLAERIRENFEQLDRVVCLWRRAGRWIPTPFAIRMPKQRAERASCSPEQGAAQLLDLAFGFARDHDARHLRFDGFGLSKREETAKVLFSIRCEPNTEPDEEDAKRKHDNAVIDAASVLSDAVQKMGSQLDASFSRELQAVDKVIEMARDNSANTQAAIWGLAFQYRARRDEQDHAERMEEIRTSAAATDRLFDTLGGPLSNLFERWMVSKLGVDGAAFTSGTFAERLSAIVHSLGEPALAECKRIVGDDAWDVLKAMSNAADDATFTAQGKRFVELLGPNPTAKFQEIARAIGQGNAAALLRLISDAGIAE